MSVYQNKVDRARRQLETERLHEFSGRSLHELSGLRPMSAKRQAELEAELEAIERAKRRSS